LRSAIMLGCAATALAIKTTLTTGTGGSILPAPTNLLLNKPATESSTYSASSNAQAKNAVDGNPSCMWNNGASGLGVSNVLSSTNFEPNPWLNVDMGTSQAVQSLVVKNRADCCQDRLTNY